VQKSGADSLQKSDVDILQKSGGDILQKSGADILQKSGADISGADTSSGGDDESESAALFAARARLAEAIDARDVTQLEQGTCVSVFLHAFAKSYYYTNFDYGNFHHRLLNVRVSAL
jgi:hypothetical protein